MKFVADHMLGKLARWLRFIGYDTLYLKDMNDDELIALVVREKRVLLTRDKFLAKKSKGIFIKSPNLTEQLAQVFFDAKMKIDEEKFFTLCSLCNTEVIKVEEKNKIYLPIKIKGDLWFCPKCNKYYWHGSHWEKIIKEVRKLPHKV
ncbi:MAG: Mut7-C RNAse domain-containing protein [Candidatus Thermoplasmatota archaeon]